MKNILIALFVLLSLVSCEKVIELEVTNRETTLVVDGLVTNTPGGTRVILTNSLRVNDKSTPPPVSGAQVRIVEQERNLSEVMRETKPNSGIYEPTTANFRGRVGSSYRLAITLPNGTEYESEVEPLARLTQIDSIYAKPLTSNQFDYDPNVPRYEVLLDITDPANERNYYRFLYYVNDTLNNAAQDSGVGSDELFDGQSLRGSISFSNTKTRKGVRAKIEMYSISQAAFNYYSLIGRQIFNGGPFATPPEPLRGNMFRRGNRNQPIFGYFSASAVTNGTVKVGQ
jgi:Domain of unknown function (DUF4249)